MGILDHYRQFEGMSDEEVSAALRAGADERRRRALARVERLDLSRTTWPEYPPHTVVNAITYVARRGLHRYLEAQRRAARASSPAATTSRPSSRRRRRRRAAALLGRAVADRAGRRADHAVALLSALSGDGAPRARQAPSRSRASPSTRSSPRSPTARASWRSATPTTRRASCSAAELRRLLDALPERVVVLLDEALGDFVDAEPADASLALLEDAPAAARLPHLLQGLGPRRAALRLRDRRAGTPSRCSRELEPDARRQRARAGRRARGAARARHARSSGACGRRRRARAAPRRAAAGPVDVRAEPGERPVAAGRGHRRRGARAGGWRAPVSSSGPAGRSAMRG